MAAFRAAHASAPEWREAATECIRQLGTIPGAANLGFLYVSDLYVQSLPQLLAFLKEETGIEHWVGSVGVGVCGSGQEYFDRPAMSVLVGDFPDGGFRVFPPVRADIGEFEREHRDWCRQAQARFAVVHGDPHNPRTAGFIAELAQALDAGFLVGGITSSRAQNLQIADRVTYGGVSGVVFSDRVAITTALTQGCSPIGPMHQVTDCQDNILIGVDGRPALEVFREEIGELLARDLARVAGYIFVGFPIRGSDTGDYLVRNVIGVDTRNQMIAVGEALNVGDSIVFCRRDTRTAQEDLLRMLGDIKRRAGTSPRGGLYYSCLGRGRHMFGENSEELKIVQKELGDFPLVGFFANGEISHNRLYGYTGVLTLFL